MPARLRYNAEPAKSMHFIQNTIVSCRRECHLPECSLRSILRLQYITARNVGDHIQVRFARLLTVDSFGIGLFDDSAMTAGTASTNVAMKSTKNRQNVSVGRASPLAAAHAGRCHVYSRSCAISRIGESSFVPKKICPLC